MIVNQWRCSRSNPPYDVLLMRMLLIDENASHWLIRPPIMSFIERINQFSCDAQALAYHLGAQWGWERTQLNCICSKINARSHAKLK